MGSKLWLKSPHPHSGPAGGSPATFIISLCADASGRRKVSDEFTVPPYRSYHRNGTVMKVLGARSHRL
jgi:hypothetical protein